MSTAKSILKYIGIVFGLTALVVGICFFVMFVSPGTKILSFQYVKLQNEKTFRYNETTNENLNNVTAVKITATQSRIEFLPGETNDFVVKYNQDIHGYAKTINADAQVVAKIEDVSFVNKASTVKTFVVDIVEPTGWINSARSVVKVFLPKNITFGVLYAKTYNSSISFDTEVDGNIIKLATTNNLYFMSSKDISISGSNENSNYFFSTQNGNVLLNDITTLKAKNIYFETSNGSFVFSNQNRNALVDLGDGELSIYSNGSPHLRLDRLNGNLKVIANAGTYDIKNINNDTEKNVFFETNSATISFDNVKGLVSIYNGNNPQRNNIHIKSLVSSSSTSCHFESNGGDVSIQTLKAPTSISTNSGNISLSFVDGSFNQTLQSTSGNISVNYYPLVQTMNLENTLNITSSTGDIEVNGINCFVNVNILGDNSRAKVSLGFAAVCYAQGTNNIINARNHTVNLAFYSAGDYLPCRLFTKHFATVTTSVRNRMTEVVEGDNDYELDDFEDYLHQYRFAYTSSSFDYAARGRILVNSNNNVVVMTSPYGDLG